MTPVENSSVPHSSDTISYVSPMSEKDIKGIEVNKMAIIPPPVLLDIDFSSPQHLVNPWPDLRRIADADPLFWSDRLKGWLITRHEDVKWAYGSSALSADRIHFYLRTLPVGSAERYATMLKYHGMTLGFQDNPDHVRVRTLMVKAFTKAAVERLIPTVRSIVNDVLDLAAEMGEFDFVRDLSHLVPTRVIQTVLGVPSEFGTEFFPLASAVILAASKLSPSAEEMERAEDAVVRLNRLFVQLIREREERPYDDLLSALVRSRNEGDRLSQDELLAACLVIIEAGAETTGHMIGNAVFEIARRPELREQILANERDAYQVVEELLRFPGLVRGFHRVAAETIDRHGKRILPGDMVFIMNSAANVDPKVFEDPMSIRTGRDLRHSMAFAPGLHSCLGMMLARAELVEFLTATFRRFDVEILDDSPPLMESFVFRCFTSMKVRFRPAKGAAVLGNALAQSEGSVS